MDFPLVSVVMSVFNGETFLAEAIESILIQTYTDFEFIIVDDGSTDESSEILRRYADRDTRVCIYRHENRGRAESLNRGISLATGSYVARMDADDVALPARFRDQIQFMEKHPDVGLLGGTYERIDANGCVLNIVRPPVSDEEIRLAMLRANPMCHPAVMMRKDIAVAAGGYRKVFLDADDYDLWLRIGERARLANLEKPILQYRVHRNQVSVSNSAHQTLCVIAAQTAASFRKYGRPDPLSGVNEITVELLHSLGVPNEQIEQALVGNLGYWTELLRAVDPEALLRVIDEFLRVADPRWMKRSVVADIWLKAASIHLQQGRSGKALLCAGRGIATRPLIAGRPIKKALNRLFSAKA